jgi:hypothetical protein
VVHHTHVVGIAFVLVLLMATSGCTETERTVEGAYEGRATVSFTEERFNLGRPVHIGVQVESVGGYEFIWVKPDGVEGGYRINRSSDRPVLYISNDGFRTTSLGVCYKPSLTSDCGFYTGDPTEFNPTVEVYGVKEGEKELIGRYSLTTQINEASYSR